MTQKEDQELSSLMESLQVGPESQLGPHGFHTQTLRAQRTGAPYDLPRRSKPDTINNEHQELIQQMDTLQMGSKPGPQRVHIQRRRARGNFPTTPSVPQSAPSECFFEIKPTLRDPTSASSRDIQPPSFNTEPSKCDCIVVCVKCMKFEMT